VLDYFDATGRVFLHSDVPMGSGLGASSTLVVALSAILAREQDDGLGPYELADRARNIEDDLGIIGGMQDQYAATFGGFNFIEFGKDRNVVHPLRIPADVLNELEHNLLLVFTGTTRQSSNIIADQLEQMGKGTNLHALREQKYLAVAMKDSLLRHRLSEFGDLLGCAWEAKKQMSSKITTPAIDELYKEAMQHGALGGKITGAGGGGFMLFYCEFEKKHLVAERLALMGAQVWPFCFEPQGVETWRA
jgi:D-glycero-alpha-D-manno-heptose-7-phosphate kinase